MNGRRDDMYRQSDDIAQGYDPFLQSNDRQDSYSNSDMDIMNYQNQFNQMNTNLNEFDEGIHDPFLSMDSPNSSFEDELDPTWFHRSAQSENRMPARQEYNNSMQFSKRNPRMNNDQFESTAPMEDPFQNFNFNNAANEPGSRRSMAPTFDTGDRFDHFNTQGSNAGMMNQPQMGNSSMNTGMNMNSNQLNSRMARRSDNTHVNQPQMRQAARNMNQAMNTSMGQRPMRGMAAGMTDAMGSKHPDPFLNTPVSRNAKQKVQKNMQRSKSIAIPSTHENTNPYMQYCLTSLAILFVAAVSCILLSIFVSSVVYTQYFNAYNIHDEIMMNIIQTAAILGGVFTYNTVGIYCGYVMFKESMSKLSLAVRIVLFPVFFILYDLTGLICTIPFFIYNVVKASSYNK